jgi:membrane-bound lytic murein transglycosylase B
MQFTFLIMIGGLLAFNLAPSNAYSQTQNFKQWLGDFKQEALAQNIPPRIFDAALGHLKPNPQVIKLDRKQPEGKISFSQYKRNIVSKQRIEAGVKKWQKHRALLQKIADHYQVPAQYIVALWGIETNYGSFIGKSDTLRSLMTLAYEGRRADFFKKELIILMRLVTDKQVTLNQLKGSWAGAVGHSQFMPSSFERYAVDWNKNGKKDLWKEMPDVFASIANYLHSEGWSAQTPWGVAIQKPKHRALVYDDLYTKLPFSAVKKLQIKPLSTSSIAPYNGAAYLMHPGVEGEGSYLVYDNYHVLLKWNRSRYFATSVGLLADALQAKFR